MEHPAHYVIITGSEPLAYRDTFGALSCALDLLDGPGPCLALVEDLAPVALRADWPEAEGGWLLDLHRRHVIFFGIPEAPDASVLAEEVAEQIEAAIAALDTDPSRYLQQLAPTWPGWTLVWDPRGVRAFAEYLAAQGYTSARAD